MEEKILVGTKKEKSASLSEGATEKEVDISAISLGHDFSTTIRTMSNENGERDRRLKQLIEAMSDEEQEVCCRYMRTNIITNEHSRRTLAYEEQINSLKAIVKGWGK